MDAAVTVVRWTTYEPIVDPRDGTVFQPPGLKGVRTGFTTIVPLEGTEELWRAHSKNIWMWHPGAAVGRFKNLAMIVDSSIEGSDAVLWSNRD